MSSFRPYYYRQANGEPLSPTSRYRYPTNLRQFFKWLTQQNHLLYNPASELVLPKAAASLPVVLLNDYGGAFHDNKLSDNVKR